MNHFRWNLARRNHWFDVPVTTRSLCFMRLLYRLGMIRRLLKLTNKRYRVYIAWNSYKGVFPTFRTYSTPSQTFIMNVHALQIACTYIGYSHIILSTSKGLLTHKEARYHNVGGVIVGVLN